MSYQVFARKYRPKTFDDLLGQEHVVRTLRNAILQDRLAHAYLFVGPRGTGKTSTARIFAKALNCTGGPSVDFDPEDEACREIAEGRSLDVLEIDGASNNGVEQVRELRESVKYAPAKSRFKIYYIDEVHMLTAAAFNALLKTLEEPPPHVKFIFATTEANKILPTIISRCQRFDLRRIPIPIIARHLLHIAQLEGVNLDEKAAFAIGKGAEGGMRDAQSMLDQLVSFCGDTIRETDVLDIFGLTSVETVANLAQCILDSNTVGGLKLVHQQTEAGKDLGRLLGDLIQHFRTLLVSQADPGAAAEDLEPDIAEQVRAQSAAASTEQLLRVVDGLAEVDARMRWATNKRLHFELGVIQAVQHLSEVSLTDVIDALDGGGKPLPPARPGPRPAPPPQQEARRVALTAPSPGIPATTPRQPERETESALPAEVPQPPTRGPDPQAAAPTPARPTPTTPAPRDTTAPDLADSGEISPAPIAPPRQDSAPTHRDKPAPAPPAAGNSLAPSPKPTVQTRATASATRTDPPSAGEIWDHVMTVLRDSRPLIVGWAVQAAAQTFERGTLKLGFPTTEKSSRDSLMRENHRTFLETVASDWLGSPVKFDMVLDSTLAPPPTTELEFGFGLGFDDPPPPPAPRPPAAPSHEPSAKPPAAKSATTGATAPKPEAATLVSPEEFLNDPLIKAAIEQFKLKIAGFTPD